MMINSATALLPVTAGVSASAGLFVMQAVESGPWWLVIVAAMGGFVALMVKHVLRQQELMHEENRRSQAARDLRQKEKDIAWEKREDVRDAAAVLALQAHNNLVMEVRLMAKAIEAQKDVAIVEVRERLHAFKNVQQGINLALQLLRILVASREKAGALPHPIDPNLLTHPDIETQEEPQ
jgi:uncharacterized membrane protein